MWIFTDKGFFSIVRNRDNHNLLIVRSRMEKDREEFVKLLPTSEYKVWEDHAADYVYRLEAHKDYVRVALSRLVDAIDYDNFKDSVAERQSPERAFLYGEVWLTMRQLEHIDRFEVE